MQTTKLRPSSPLESQLVSCYQRWFPQGIIHLCVTLFLFAVGAPKLASNMLNSRAVRYTVNRTTMVTTATHRSLASQGPMAQFNAPKRKATSAHEVTPGTRHCESWCSENYSSVSKCRWLTCRGCADCGRAMAGVDEEEEEEEETEVEEQAADRPKKKKKKKKMVWRKKKKHGGGASLVRPEWEHKAASLGTSAAGRHHTQKAIAVHGDDVAPIAISTQCSIDQLSHIETMALNWGGQISVAVYVREYPGTEASTKSLEKLRDFGRRMYATCSPKWPKWSMNIVMVNQPNATDTSGSISDVSYYPINMLRNTALAEVRAPLVLLTDAHNCPSINLYRRLVGEDDAQLLRKALGHDAALVVPTFEYFGLQDPVWDDVTIRSAWNSKNAIQFQVQKYWKGHSATDYKRWFAGSKSRVDTHGRLDISRHGVNAYGINYEYGYEPYLIASSQTVPWYDAQFTSYRFNKISHRFEMSMMFRFFVLDHRDSFLVAQAHAPFSWEPPDGKGMERGERQRKKEWEQNLTRKYDKIKRSAINRCARIYSDKMSALRPRRARVKIPPPAKQDQRQIILGVGMGRTGTTSLETALTRLGKQGHRWNSWDKPVASALGIACGAACDCKEKLFSRDFRESLIPPSGKDFIMDSPVPELFINYFWLFPQAKFILTDRPAEEWARSRMHNRGSHSDVFAPVQQPCREGIGSFNESELAILLNIHNELVRCAVPQSRLLVIDLWRDSSSRSKTIMDELADFIGAKRLVGDGGSAAEFPSYQFSDHQGP